MARPVFLGHAGFDYSDAVKASKEVQLQFQDVPGFTRSFQRDNHALIAGESHVWAPHPRWPGCSTAHLISPATKANFAMSLVKLPAGATGTAAAAGVERFVFVLNGSATAAVPGADLTELTLAGNDYLYLPPGEEHTIMGVAASTDLLVFERLHAGQGTPEVQHGHTDEHPLLPVPGEVFELRKLLPPTAEYDFNVHIMDFKPGEYLNVKEVHYNQHGLLLLEGRGIYRLGDDWFPIQAGDVLWMGPYVPQWYAALGNTRTRYLIYKDTTLDPLETPWLFGQGKGKPCGCATAGKPCGCAAAGKPCDCQHATAREEL